MREKLNPSPNQYTRASAREQEEEVVQLNTCIPWAWTPRPAKPEQLHVEHPRQEEVEWKHHWVLELAERWH